MATDGRSPTMANETRYFVVLRQALGKNPSPDAFVTGK